MDLAAKNGLPTVYSYREVPRTGRTLAVRDSNPVMGVASRRLADEVVHMRRREILNASPAAPSRHGPLSRTPSKEKRWRGSVILALASELQSQNPATTFLQGLRDLGYVEGRNFVLVDRYAEGQQERAPELAVELVQLEVDIIVAPTSGSAKAAKNATSDVPIVMAGSGDPVGLGLVASLARPGGNVTGPSMMNTEIVGKRMQLLKEVVPGLVRVAVLVNSFNPIHAIFWRETAPAVRELGFELQPVEARAPKDLDVAFDLARRSKAGALIALDDALTYAHRTRVVALPP